MISVIIADDHQMFIDGIKVLLEQVDNIRVIGHALNGRLLLDVLETTQADIVLMDINMPLLDGTEATKIIKQRFPQIKVLMLTMYNTREYITGMINAGASGYILKNTGKEELIKAIETIYSGGTFYSLEVTNRVMESFRKKDNHLAQVPELTTREKEIIQLFAKELTGASIASMLNISPHTVEAHRKNMLVKFNVRTTVGLIRMASEQGLIE